MLKKITYAFIGLLLLLVAVALVVPLFLNPESMKAPMLRQIEAMTGYKVNVAGDVSVRLLPSARLRLADVSITSSLSAENDKPFAKARELDVGVKLLPLLSGKVEITRLALQNPELTLVQSAGKNNWQTKPAMTKPATTESAKTNGDAAVASAILLQAFEISDGALSYKNTQTGQQVVMSGLNVEAGMRALDAPFTFAAKTVWNGKPAKLKLTLDSLAAVLNNNQSPLVFSFASDGLSADLKGLLDPLKFSGALAIKSDSVMQAIAWLSGAKPVADALPVKLDIKGESVCALNNCGLNNATIQVNDTLLLGSIKANMAGARPEIAADFSTKLLDMTPYLAKKTAEFKLIRSAFAESARWSRKPIDLSGLKAVDATMSIKTDRLLANKFTVDNAVIRAKISNGALSADMINASLYQGKATLNINMMADGRIDGRVSTQGVELEPLLAALSDSDRFSGKANMHLAFASQGRSVQALVSNLDGGADIRLADGSVKGVDLAGMIRNVKSAFTGAATAQRKTDFAELGGTFTIARGIITNNDLAMKAPLFRVSGKGTVDLPNYTLNYLLNPQLVDTAKGQGGADKQGLGVPIRITGSLDNPSYAPDLQEAIQDALKDPQKIKDAVKDAKELFKDKNSIKDLKGLLKGF